MADDDSGSREMGIELGELDDEIDSLSYPVGKDELLEEYGDRELDMASGEETLAEVLGPLQEDEFESADQLRQSIFNMVGGEAVGRQGYTDRGASSDPEDDESSDESF